MSQLMIDVEISMTHEEFAKFKELSDLLDEPLPLLAMRCMQERRDQLLDEIKNNVPIIDSDK